MDLSESHADAKITIHGEPWSHPRIIDIVHQLEKTGVHQLDERIKTSILLHVLSSQFPYENSQEEFKYLCSDVIEKLTGRPAIIEHNKSIIWDLLFQLCGKLKEQLPIRTCGQRIHRLISVSDSHVVVASVPINRTDDDDYDPKDSLYFNEEQH